MKWIALWAAIAVLLPVDYSEKSLTEYEGLIILKIRNMNDELRSDLYQALTRYPTTQVEYTCMESGVVVLKFANSVLHEKADVATMITGQLQGYVDASSIQVIWIEVREQVGVMKC